MTSALASPPGAQAQRALDLDDVGAPPPRGRTLEEAVLEASETLRLRGTAACLVCGEPTDDAGECPACGARLD